MKLGLSIWISRKFPKTEKKTHNSRAIRPRIHPGCFSNLRQNLKLSILFSPHSSIFYLEKTPAIHYFSLNIYHPPKKELHSELPEIKRSNSELNFGG